jgi:reactive intermediate/imine deaminase
VDLTIISPPDLHPTVGYSHAIRHGNYVFVAGQTALDRDGKLVGQGDMHAQAIQVFANLKAVLEAAGSGLDRIVKTTTFMTDLEQRPAFSKVRQELFEPLGYYPPNTLVEVSRLFLPDMLVEVEAIAVCDR